MGHGVGPAHRLVHWLLCGCRLLNLELWGRLALGCSFLLRHVHGEGCKRAGPFTDLHGFNARIPAAGGLDPRVRRQLQAVCHDLQLKFLGVGRSLAWILRDTHLYPGAFVER